MTTKGFTKINNSIIFNADLSLEAIGLYVKLQYLSTIDNFSIKRDYIRSISGYGETAFRRVWKELKDKGVLIETKSRSKGRYEYKYTLKTDNTAKVTAPTEEKKPKHIDSDGNTPLDGQVNIDDVIGADQQEKPVINKNTAEIVKATGFDDSQAKELLKLANNNESKVIESYNYTLKQREVRNTFNYTKWVIANKINVQESNTVKSTFNNFKQRQYDFDRLKKALLYGEPYELPA
ncbi:hypothetical protein [Clostridium magnum]|uniref:Helix-turn-helix domain-containing protein n=1 Tax=Clostridium magnum DSM 2767 TaxID=1121326 RepID=A0A161X272_9CLOT|nr:hypothetical protein [Clostridium magnum]KZL93578.1 hypothetical protein CLMAG_06240 [Clostridium magnum DSM 2767]SHI59529.1 hypothetical protein SAMN02745944_04552 [Clostridium magnum DSM 2767]